MPTVADGIDDDAGIKRIRIIIRKDIRIRAGDGIDNRAMIRPRYRSSVIQRSRSRDSNRAIPCIDCAHRVETIECIIELQNDGCPGLFGVTLGDFASSSARQDGAGWVPGAGEVGGAPVGELGGGGEEVVVVVVKDDAWVAAVVVCGEGEGKVYILCCG